MRDEKSESEMFCPISMFFDKTRFDRVENESKFRILIDDSPLVFFMKVLKQGQEDGSIMQSILAENLVIILWSKVSGVFERIALRGKLLDML
ncbi:MAG: hypothetical protein J7K46_02050 [Bacteroidales bacterium]|nr:hypothetical protein [Bacteroidales bacterium]